MRLIFVTPINGILMMSPVDHCDMSPIRPHLPHSEYIKYLLSNTFDRSRGQTVAPNTIGPSAWRWLMLYWQFDRLCAWPLNEYSMDCRRWIRWNKLFGCAVLRQCTYHRCVSLLWHSTIDTQWIYPNPSRHRSRTSRTIDRFVWDKTRFVKMRPLSDTPRMERPRRTNANTMRIISIMNILWKICIRSKTIDDRPTHDGDTLRAQDVERSGKSDAGRVRCWFRSNYNQVKTKSGDARTGKKTTKSSMPGIRVHSIGVDVFAAMSGCREVFIKNEFERIVWFIFPAQQSSPAQLFQTRHAPRTQPIERVHKKNWLLALALPYIIMAIHGGNTRVQNVLCRSVFVCFASTSSWPMNDCTEYVSTDRYHTEPNERGSFVWFGLISAFETGDRSDWSESAGNVIYLVMLCCGQGVSYMNIDPESLFVQIHPSC